MKKLQALFLISLFFVVPFAAYAKEDHLPSAAKAHHWVELSVGATRSFGRLKDGGGYTQLTHLNGLSGRALVAFLPWLSVGAEGTWFEKEKDIAYVSSYKARRYGLIGKFTLTPDTEPKVYLLGGYGKTKQSFTYLFPLNETHQTNYFLVGVGLDVDIWKNIFLAAEGYGLYNTHRHISRFFEQQHRLETGVLVRVGVKF